MAELPNSFHTHQSWGRTRSPKGVITGQRTSPVVILAHNATPSGTAATAPDDGTGGYVTENQRSLFVTIDTHGAPGQDLEVWVYLHASGVWALFDTVNCDGIEENTTYKVEIAGADRVAFVKSAAWNNDPTAVYAACSTF